MSQEKVNVFDKNDVLDKDAVNKLIKKAEETIKKSETTMAENKLFIKRKEEKVNVFDKDEVSWLIDKIEDAVKEAENFNDYTDANEEITMEELIDNISVVVDELKNYIYNIGKPIKSDDQPPILFNNLTE